MYCVGAQLTGNVALESSSSDEALLKGGGEVRNNGVTKKKQPIMAAFGNR